MNTMTALLSDLKLRFNIEHPNFEECYTFGYECARADIDETENPFKQGSKESEQWLEGWWAGFYGEEPLYELGSTYKIQEVLTEHEAANDHLYEKMGSFFAKVVEITSLIAVSAAVGYQMIDLVA
jgi:hypothetical protein